MDAVLRPRLPSPRGIFKPEEFDFLVLAVPASGRTDDRTQVRAVS